MRKKYTNICPTFNIEKSIKKSIEKALISVDINVKKCYYKRMLQKIIYNITQIA